MAYVIGPKHAIPPTPSGPLDAVGHCVTQVDADRLAMVRRIACRLQLRTGHVQVLSSAINAVIAGNCAIAMCTVHVNRLVNPDTPGWSSPSTSSHASGFHDAAYWSEVTH